VQPENETTLSRKEVEVIMESVPFPKPEACPSCGDRDIKQIVYGYPPADEIMEQARRHEVVLGGNLFWDTMPDWICFRCNHRWLNPNDPGRIQRAEKWHEQEVARKRSLPVLPPKTMPDDPVSFGFKNAWWALSTVATEAVVAAIRLQNPERCNWANGVKEAYEDSIFVTPPVQGWTLVVGGGLWWMDRNARQHVLEPLLQLSKHFGTALAFATHRVVEYHVWAKAVAGSLVRGFGYVGESGVTFWNEGPMTPEEEQLGFASFGADHSTSEPELHAKRTNRHSPNEMCVMDIARKWSVSPYDLEELKPVTRELGVLGGGAHLFDAREQSCATSPGWLRSVLMQIWRCP
jgi:hypothetical protein